MKAFMLFASEILITFSSSTYVNSLLMNDFCFWRTHLRFDFLSNWIFNSSCLGMCANFHRWSTLLVNLTCHSLCRYKRYELINNTPSSTPRTTSTPSSPPPTFLMSQIGILVGQLKTNIIFFSGFNAWILLFKILLRFFSLQFLGIDFHFIKNIYARQKAWQWLISVARKLQRQTIWEALFKFRTKLFLVSGHWIININTSIRQKNSKRSYISTKVKKTRNPGGNWKVLQI